MSKDIKLKSYAKINISLNIISKEKYGNHKIESLFSFIDLYDEIFIKKIKSKNHKISFVGKYSKNIGKKNTVSKLMKILDKVILHNKMKYFIKINKKIPQKAGLGGGSMNAATVLNYFSRKRDKNYKIANLIGSDVKLGLNKYNKILLSSEQIIKIKKNLNMNLLIIKPFFGCSTKEIYSKVKNFSSINFKNFKKNLINKANFKKYKNDLEKIVLNKYPSLSNLKRSISKLPRISFVRMTGSGSCFIAYFNSRIDTINAAKIFKKKHKNYLCIISKTI
tara:strand:- start:23260 stop:24093 length:834 start_codon:yes stop_codon:yes gene_type:complete